MNLKKSLQRRRYARYGQGILVGGRQAFLKECFDSNILSIRDLLNSNGQLLYQEFHNNYDCNTNFLLFCQVTSAIPHYLVIKARLNTEPLANEVYTRNNFLFQLDHSTQIQLENAKTTDFYGLVNRKVQTVRQTGPMKWNSIISLAENAWKKIFTVIKSVYKETKLKEFHFKLIHKIVVTKKSFVDMVLKQTMNVSTVESKIQLVTHFSMVDL